ncbi:MAG TPA: alpha/beta hydrolase domain-containing protein, partial [Microthrixaceae bacterium]|nr:alpha/beta hydrolase domain-containing protein [Microthrixaceae bacterium]
PNASTMCLLMGSTIPLSDAQLAELYPSRAKYLEEFESSTDEAISAGFVLADDRKAMIAEAQPERLAE